MQVVLCIPQWKMVLDGVSVEQQSITWKSLLNAMYRRGTAVWSESIWFLIVCLKLIDLVRIYYLVLCFNPIMISMYHQRLSFLPVRWSLYIDISQAPPLLYVIYLKGHFPQIYNPLPRVVSTHVDRLHSFVHDLRCPSLNPNTVERIL